MRGPLYGAQQKGVSAAVLTYGFNDGNDLGGQAGFAVAGETMVFGRLSMKIGLENCRWPTTVCITS